MKPADYDRRITELLEANNREVERRRAAERRVMELEATLTNSSKPPAGFEFTRGDDGSRWPADCRQKELCELNVACLTVGCVHRQRNIMPEILAAQLQSPTG